MFKFSISSHFNEADRDLTQLGYKQPDSHWSTVDHRFNKTFYLISDIFGDGPEHLNICKCDTAGFSSSRTLDSFQLWL